jgi:hypothetical protein
VGIAVAMTRRNIAKLGKSGGERKGCHANSCHEGRTLILSMYEFDLFLDDMMCLCILRWFYCSVLICRYDLSIVLTHIVKVLDDFQQVKAIISFVHFVKLCWVLDFSKNDIVVENKLYSKVVLF